MRNNNVIGKILTIFISILMVISILITFTSATLRTTVLSPGFYSRSLVHTSAYNGFYDLVYNMLETDAASQEGIPDDYRDKIPDIIDNAIPKRQIKRYAGELLGAGLGWLIYNQEDKEVPIQAIIDGINESLQANEEIMDYENMYEVLSYTLTTYLDVFVLPEGNELTYRGYMHYYLASNYKPIMDNLDYYVDELFYTYGRWLNMITLLSILFTIGLLVLLFFVSKKDIKYILSLAIVILMVLGIGLIALSIALMGAVPILTRMGKISDTVKSFVPIIRPIISQFGIVYLLSGVLYIGLSIIGIYFKKINLSIK